MEFCLDASVSGFLPETSPEYVIGPACSNLGSGVNELFPYLRTEEEVSLEWLSIFVEDCLSSTVNCVPATPHHLSCTAVTKSFKPIDKSHQNPYFNTKFAIPVKPRSKRRRPTSPKTHENPLISWSSFKHVNPKKNPTLQFCCSDPPLLQQSQWLADSELIILPRNEGSCCIESSKEEKEKKMKRKKMEEVVIESSGGGGGVQGVVQVRRCSHCQAQKTPQWRAGPLGPKTLCNACGVRFKSGRLFPEYRPAKSPTFVSCMHSNSHKKVLEMRMALLSSSSDQH